MKNSVYDGVLRVTDLVGKLSKPMPDNWLDMIDEDTSWFTEEDVLDWSADFGTRVNDSCLFDSVENLTELETRCVNNFNIFVDRYKPRFIDKEKTVVRTNGGMPIYAGTFDFSCRIKGKKSIVDIKTWGSWRHHFGIAPVKKEIKSYNKSKVALQTSLYNESDDCGGAYDQYVLWLTPDFYMFEKLKPSRKTKEAIELAKELSGVNVLLNF